MESLESRNRSSQSGGQLNLAGTCYIDFPVLGGSLHGNVRTRTFRSARHSGGRHHRRRRLRHLCTMGRITELSAARQLRCRASVATGTVFMTVHCASRAFSSARMAGNLHRNIGRAAAGHAGEFCDGAAVGFNSSRTMWLCRYFTD